MAKSGAIRAGKAYVELFADNSRLIRGLRLAERHLKDFGGAIRAIGLKMMALGAAITLPMLKAAQSFSKMGDQVAKMAKRTGLSVETLSELRYVASQTGTEFESLEMAFRRMQRSIYDAGRGLSTAVDALADLGLTFQDLEGLSPEEQFKLLAERISQIEDPTRRAGIAMTLFGRTGTNLLPMFAQGAAGIEALQEEARKLGLTMSSEDAAAAEEFTDALDRLWKVLRMGVFQIGASLAPTLQLVSENVTQIIAAINEWIKANRGLVFMVASVGAAILAAGAVLVVFGTTVTILGAIVGKLVAAFGLIQAALTAILSPVGLTIAAVASLGAAILYYTGAGGKALEWLKSRFMRLKSDIGAAVAAISTALSAGDISLAARILWLTLKMEWLRGTKYLEDIWLTFRRGFLQAAFDAFYGFRAAWEIAVNAVVVAMIEATAGLKKAWADFTAWHATSVEKTANWITKKWMQLRSLFDDSIDMTFVEHYLDEQSRQRFADIEKERTEALRNAEQNRDALRDAAAEEHDKTIEKLAREYTRKADELDSDYEKRIAETESKLAEARKEWSEAIAAAKQGSAESSSLSEQFRGIGDFLTDQAQKISIAGTFGAEQLWGLGAGSALDRTALACEQTARNTKRLIDETKNNNATFS